MKICDEEQVLRNEAEEIKHFERQSESFDTIWKIFNEKITFDKRRKNRRRKLFAVIVACIIVVVTSNWKGIYSFASEFLAKITITSKDIEYLSESMKLITVNEPEKLDSYGVYIGNKHYTSLKECTDELGIEILTSDLACDAMFDDKVILSFPMDGDEKFGMNLVTINDFMYIIGDLREFELQGTAAYYKSPQLNDQYGSPISLNIEFFITGMKRNIEESHSDYSGLSYSYHEIYKGTNGITAQIIGNQTEGKGDYTAIFYENDMKYTLTGLVTLTELKRIIDSFK